MAEVPKTARLAGLAESQRRWLDAATEASGLSLTQIARAAHIAPTTLTRFRNDPEHSGTLSFATVMAVSEVSGLATTPEILGGAAPAARRGLRETEAMPYAVERGGELARAVAAFVGNAGHLVPWELKTRALEEEGYLPGDILIVDLNASPVPDDIVCAQLYDWANPGATQTIWRIYDAPFLIAATRDRATRKPLLVDGEKVVMKGVVISMLRPRRQGAA